MDELRERYLSCFGNSWTDSTALDDARFVVLDSETTGTDAQRDRLISIGAIAVRQGEIRLDDAFEALLKVAYNASAVTVHGITRDAAVDGMDEDAALALFVDYLRDGVIVGHHIGFDISIINNACLKHFGFELQNRFVDTMALTLHLERDGAFSGQADIRSFSLDALCQLFGVIPHDRHTAPGDAFITAQIFLRLLRLAKKFDRASLVELCEPFTPVER